MRTCHCDATKLIALLTALIVAASLVVGCGDESFEYQVHVLDRDTGQAIVRARVTIEGSGAPRSDVTDDNGVARVFVDASSAGNPGRLIVEAKGYETYMVHIDLDERTLPDTVSLEPEDPCTMPFEVQVNAAPGSQTTITFEVGDSDSLETITTVEADGSVRITVPCSYGEQRGLLRVDMEGYEPYSKAYKNWDDLPRAIDLKPIPPPPPYEDFEGERLMDWWSPDPHVFAYSETNEQAHSGTRSLRVEYRKTDTYQYVAAKPPEELSDFSEAEALDVWVYGQETFLLKLRDENGQEVEVDTLTADNPQGWTLLRFNLAGVYRQIDLSHIDNIFLFPAPGDASAAGTVYLDDICLASTPVGVPALTSAPSPVPEPSATPTTVSTSTRAPEPTRTPTTAPTSTRAPEPTPIPSDTSVMLEDFEGERQMDWWASDSQVFGYGETQEVAHDGSRSLKIAYEKIDTYQFIAAKPPDELSDFTERPALDVWVYGQVELLLKLKDSDGREVEVDTLAADNAQGWQLLRFDLTRVADEFNLSQIDNLFFFPAPGNPSISGTIYFDDISLAPKPVVTAPTPVQVLHEGFEVGRLMDWWSPDPQVFAYSETDEQAHSGAKSLKVDYKKTDTFQFFAAKPPAALSDFGEAQALDVWVYGQETLLLKLRDIGGQEVDVDTLTANKAQDWTLLRFNLTGVDGQFELGHIDNIFFFPAPDSAQAEGTIYLDDISLVEQP